MKRWKALILIIFLMFPMTVKATRTQELTQNTDETQNEKIVSETTEEAEAVSQEEVQESLLDKFDFSEKRRSL